MRGSGPRSATLDSRGRHHTATLAMTSTVSTSTGV